MVVISVRRQFGPYQCRRQQQHRCRATATRWNCTCLHGLDCIHKLRCWGVHTAEEIEVFRGQQEVAERVVATQQSETIAAEVGLATAQIQAVVDALLRRWQQRLAEPPGKCRQAFFDAELIPRRRAHRRLRKRQRSAWRRERRQRRKQEKRQAKQQCKSARREFKRLMREGQQRTSVGAQYSRSETEEGAAATVISMEEHRKRTSGPVGCCCHSVHQLFGAAAR